MEKTRIVIVDDEPHILRVLELKLKNAGFEVFPAINGRDGLEKIRETRPQAVISDVNMPEMDGLELMAACRELRAESPFFMIMLTAQTEPEVRAAIDAEPMTELMNKPFSPRKILERIEEHFGGRMAA